MIQRIGGPEEADLISAWGDLVGWFARHANIFVLLSGGVDSSLLLVVARESLHESGTVRAVTAYSPSLSAREFQEIENFIAEQKVDHVVLKTEELQDRRYQSNLGDRCYFCKSALYEALNTYLEDQQGSLSSPVIVDGTNTDDLADHRPSLPASKKYGILHPYVELGINKETIRALAKWKSLPMWAKPAMACLSSRIQDSVVVTSAKIQMIEKAELCVSRLGCSQVRVRLHESGSGSFLQTIARIEVSRDDFGAVVTSTELEQVVAQIKNLGFDQVVLDLQGYRKGGRPLGR